MTMNIKDFIKKEKADTEFNELKNEMNKYYPGLSEKRTTKDNKKKNRLKEKNRRRINRNKRKKSK